MHQIKVLVYITALATINIVVACTECSGLRVNSCTVQGVYMFPMGEKRRGGEGGERRERRGEEVVGFEYSIAAVLLQLCKEIGLH